MLCLRYICFNGFYNHFRQCLTLILIVYSLCYNESPCVDILRARTKGLWSSVLYMSLDLVRMIGANPSHVLTLINWLIDWLVTFLNEARHLEWTFCIFGPWFYPHFLANLIFNNKNYLARQFAGVYVKRENTSLPVDDVAQSLCLSSLWISKSNFFFLSWEIVICYYAKNINEFYFWKKCMVLCLTWLTDMSFLQLQVRGHPRNPGHYVYF